MNELLQSLSDTGRGLFAWTLSANLNTLLVLCLAIAADFAFARRIAPAWRIAIYLAVFVRLLVPMQTTWSVPFWSGGAPAMTTIAAFDDPAAAVCIVPASTQVASSPAIWPFVVLGFYAAGIAMLGGSWYLSARKLRRVLQSSRPVTGDSDVLISRSAGPMVAGVRRPCIIIPAWLVASESLSLVLAHERAHIARRDPVFAFTIRFLCTIAWPIAPAWIAASRVRALMEQACDDRALGSHPQQENVMKYAKAMMDVAERSGYPRGALAFGAALRSRIKALRPARRWPAALQVASALALPAILIACSSARPSATHSELSPGVLASGSSVPHAAPAAQLPVHVEATTSASDVKDQRVITVRVVQGAVALPRCTPAVAPGDSSHPGVAIVDRAELNQQFIWFDTSRIQALPSLLVNVDESAAIRIDSDTQPFAAQFTVHRSDPDTVLATMSYSVGANYSMKPTTLKFKRGEAGVIHIPSSQLGLPSQTVIVNIDRPGDVEGC